MPIWLSVATAFLGLAEVAGPGDNPVIIQWSKDLKVPYAGDSEAWCALFLNRVLQACQLPVAGSGYDLIRAKTFVDYGHAMSHPAPGAIMVFDRPGGAHVGFYLGENASAYRIRGGNTSDRVGDAWLRKDRLLAIRWPLEEVPDAHAVILASNGEPLSTNEA